MSRHKKSISETFSTTDSFLAVGGFQGGAPTNASAFHATIAASSSPYNWAFNSNDGAALNAMRIGATTTAGTNPSQAILIHGISGGVDTADTSITVDSGGNPTITPPIGSTFRIGAVRAFAALPPCAAGTEGAQAPVNDSITNVWGAIIIGSGANHVLAYCDGTNWTVAAK
jgi:hypothetical protein